MKSQTHPTRLTLLRQHALPGVIGLLRTFVAHPAFATRLFVARLRYFLFRRFKRPLRTPDGYLIESQFELISYWSFFIERECWSKVWVDALLKERAPVVLDVGANAGLFTHLIWTLNPNARLFAFDPLPRMAKKIQQWGKETKANVVVVNKAVADKVGTTQFFTIGDCDTTASLYDDGNKRTPIEVETVTLDQAIAKDQIFLIKIDVEGAEPEVICGATQTVGNSRFLIVEAHSPVALSRITTVLGNSWQCKRIGASDYLFNRAETQTNEPSVSA